MPKKTNYFSHDSNARNDSKILAVRIKYGIEGYGIYFMILERLREESNYMCVKDYNSIAFDLRTDSSKVKSVIEDFGLFIFTDDGKYFYSESFMGRMEFKDVKSKKATENAKKRWENEKSMRTHTETDANALPTHPETDASKVKESKENKEYKESWHKDKLDFLNNSIWKENFCIGRHITLERLEKLQKDFLVDIELKKETTDNLYRYFTNIFDKKRDFNVDLYSQKQLVQ
jgi:hypothetical protein